MQTFWYLDQDDYAIFHGMTCPFSLGNGLRFVSISEDLACLQGISAYRLARLSSGYSACLVLQQIYSQFSAIDIDIAC